MDEYAVFSMGKVIDFHGNDKRGIFKLPLDRISQRKFLQNSVGLVRSLGNDDDEFSSPLPKCVLNVHPPIRAPQQVRQIGIYFVASTREFQGKPACELVV